MSAGCGVLRGSIAAALCLMHKLPTCPSPGGASAGCGAAQGGWHGAAHRVPAARPDCAAARRAAGKQRQRLYSWRRLPLLPDARSAGLQAARSGLRWAMSAACHATQSQVGFLGAPWGSHSSHLWTLLHTWSLPPTPATYASNTCTVRCALICRAGSLTWCWMLMCSTASPPGLTATPTWPTWRAWSSRVSAALSFGAVQRVVTNLAGLHPPLPPLGGRGETGGQLTAPVFSGTPPPLPLFVSSTHDMRLTLLYALQAASSSCLCSATSRAAAAAPCASHKRTSMPALARPAGKWSRLRTQSPRPTRLT